MDFFTHRGHRWTKKFPAIAEEVRRLKARRLWFDGKLVVMREDGRSCFGSLQRAIAEGDPAKLRLWAFDLLHLDDRSLPGAAAQKDPLAEFLRSPAWNLDYVDHVTGSGPKFFHLAAAQQLEEDRFDLSARDKEPDLAQEQIHVIPPKRRLGGS